MAAAPELDADGGVSPDRGATTGTSRWQKVVATIGLLVVLGLGILMFGSGGGGHNAPAGSQQQPIDAGGGGHVPPAGVPNH